MEEIYNFERAIKFSEKSFRKLMNTPRRNEMIQNRKMKIFLRMLIASLIIVFLFLFTYTIGLAIFFTFIVALGIFTNIFDKSFLTMGYRAKYYSSSHLQKETIYGINNDFIYFKNDSMDYQAKWEMLRVWQIKGDWLILNSEGMDSVFLQISELKQEGLFEKIMEKLNIHGVEYNSKKAKLYNNHHSKKILNKTKKEQLTTASS